MDFETVADELYGLALEEFTGARNDRAKRARAEGDRELATQIQSLRKPTVAAWLTNQLVRASRNELDALLQLGGELREVMADLSGDELRELTKQRHRLVFALVQQARSLGHTRGHPMSEDVASVVRETLEATLSDSASADAVASGRLTDALRVSGFGGGARAQPSAKPAARGRTSGAGAGGAGGTVTSIDAKRQQREAREQREHAQRVLDAATKAVERAKAVTEQAESRLHTAQKQREAASAAVQRLRTALDEAVTELEVEDHQIELVTQEKDAAEAELHEVNRRLAEAEAVLKSLPT